jgi:hypothetical protein
MEDQGYQYFEEKELKQPAVIVRLKGADEHAGYAEIYGKIRQSPGDPVVDHAEFCADKTNQQQYSKDYYLPHDYQEAAYHYIYRLLNQKLLHSTIPEYCTRKDWGY